MLCWAGGHGLGIPVLAAAWMDTFIVCYADWNALYALYPTYSIICSHYSNLRTYMYTFSGFDVLAHLLGLELVLAV